MNDTPRPEPPRPERPPVVDKGFALSYSHLSYRRKFIRGVWLFAFFTVSWLGLRNAGSGVADLLIILVILSAIQAILNFVLWRRGKKVK